MTSALLWPPIIPSSVMQSRVHFLYLQQTNQLSAHHTYITHISHLHEIVYVHVLLYIVYAQLMQVTREVYIECRYA